MVECGWLWLCRCGLLWLWLIMIGRCNLWLNAVGCRCGDVVGYGCG